MKTIVLSCLAFIILNGCNSQNEEDFISHFFTNTIDKNQWINPQGNTITTRIHTPDDYKRLDEKIEAFQTYLRNLSVLPDGKPVKHYDGSFKRNQNFHAAVIDISIGEQNLQECADAVIRLRAEYLWENEKYDAIQFNFTSGFSAKYTNWMNGKRIGIRGNEAYWYNGGEPSNTHGNLMDYLTMIFAYAGTISLSQELEYVELEDIQIGDIFIKGGSPGHAVIVVDKAIHSETNEMIVLLAQSFMPAQNIHVLKNLNRNDLNPWFSVSDMDEVILTPEYKFHPNHLKRFTNEALE